MANNVAVLDGAAASKTFKTTDTAGVHVSHVNVDAGGGLTATEIEVTTWTASAPSLTAATSGTLLAANADRIRFAITNLTAAAVFVRCAAGVASATVFTIYIPAAAQYMSDPFEYAGEIRGFSTPGGAIYVSEGV